MNGQVWRMKHLTRDGGWDGELVAYWEVDHDPISDDYSPDEISAEDLLHKWAESIKGKFPNDLIPIHWFVQSPGKFESMPFQFNHLADVEPAPPNFLSFYSWPVNATTGERLNWLSIPVVDKLWNAQHDNKGGFIQEATGWKPAILQPFVHLPALLDTRG